MLALYHFGDAICAKKVRLALAEKELVWESRDVAGSMLRDPEYLKLNPNGVVPTLVHDDAVFTESRVISEYIDDAFAGPQLTPPDPRERYRARSWSKQVDDSLHLNVFILSFAGAMREMFLGMPPEVLKTALPGLRDPIKRRISTELLAQGWDTSWVTMAVERFRRMVADMQIWLAQAPYLAGGSYSLADADYTAYLNRLSDMGLAGLWAEKPAVQDWWAKMQDRPSYKAAIIDWVTPVEVERYGKMRERHASEIRRFVDAA